MGRPSCRPCPSRSRLATAIQLTLSIADPAGSMTTEDELTGNGAGGGELRKVTRARWRMEAHSFANARRPPEIPHSIPMFPPMDHERGGRAERAHRREERTIARTSGVHPTAKADLPRLKIKSLPRRAPATAQTYAALAPQRADPAAAAAAARARAQCLPRMAQTANANAASPGANATAVTASRTLSEGRNPPRVRRAPTR